MKMQLFAVPFGEPNSICLIKCKETLGRLIVTGGLLVLAGGYSNAQTTISSVALVNNATQTPVEGVGHDYLHDLSETVNPQNGQVSIRIAGPSTHERGLNSPHYAFMYDTSGPYAMGGQLSFTSCSTQGSSAPSCYPRVDAPVWATAGSFLPTAGSITGQDIVFSNPEATLSLNLGQDNGGTQTCTYAGPYVYEDPEGGLHNLDLAYTVGGGAACGNTFSVSNQLLSGDAHYKAFLYGSVIYISDIHGNIVGVGYQNDEDSNGNHRNGTNRPWSFTTVSKSQLQWPSDPGRPVQVADMVTLPGVADPNKDTAVPYTYQYYSFSRSTTSGLNAIVGSNSTNNCYVDYLPLVQSSSFTAVSALLLPDQQTFTFGYDSQWGLVNSITYPTGATVAYTWVVNPLSEVFNVSQPAYDGAITSSNAETANCNFEQDLPAVQTRTVSYDGVHKALKQTFSYSTTWGSNGGWTSKQTKVTTTDLIRAGTPSTVTIYNYVPMYTSGLPWTTGGGEIAAESSIVYQDGSGNTLKTVIKNWAGIDLLAAECEMIDSSHISGKFYTYQNIPYYGPIDAPTDVAEYDYSQGLTSACSQPSSSVVPARETRTQYASLPSSVLWPSNTLVTSGWTPTAIPQINDRPSVIQVYDHGTLIAETDINYDEGTVQAVSPSAYGHDDTNYGSNQSAGRGNATTITRKCFQGCGDSITTAQYDETGQIVSVVAPNGNITGGTPAKYTTTMSYTDQFSSGGSPASGVNTNTYVTAITRPTTNSVSHSSTFTYNYMLGEVASATDENSQTSYYKYSDLWGRPTLSTYPDGGQTSIQYSDAGPNPSVTKSILQNSATNAELTTKVVEDGLGQAIQTQVTESSSSTIYTDTIVDGNGRVYELSNPTRCSSAAGSFPSSCSEATWGYNTLVFDALGRTTSKTNQDNTHKTWVYSGNTITIEDENGNKWQQTIDAFGRLSEVLEPNGSAQSASVETDYTYDALNNLLSINQKGIAGSNARARSFSYDSLSRLVCASNPESSTGVCPASASSGYVVGTTGYSYDADGNMTAKISPLVNLSSGTQTFGYCYDVLNRVTAKLTVAPSPSVCSAPPSGQILSTFAYDASSLSGAQFAIGRLTDTKSYAGATLVSERQPYVYDSMGRLQAEKQWVMGSAKTFTPMYQYDQAGNVVASTDGATPIQSFNSQFPCTLPTGVQATVASWTTLAFVNCYDVVNRTSNVTSNWATFPTNIFAIGTSGYFPSGQPQNWGQGPTVSNAPALSITQSFTNRLWPSSVTAAGQIP